MKKIFIVLSVLFAIALGAGPSMAVVGTLDDVKGVDALVPFFIVNSGYKTSSTENTLVVLQSFDTAVAWTRGYLYDVDSNLIFDWAPSALTAWDVDKFYASDILDLMTATDLAKLLVTVKATDDYYAGYIVLENAGRTTNELGGWVYQVSLAAGKASASKLPMREWAQGALTTDQGNVIGTPGTAYGQRQATSTLMATNTLAAEVLLGNRGNYEAFSANALAIASERAFGLVNLATAANDSAGASAQVTTFGLYPRYYLLDSSADSFIILWTNYALGAAYEKHINVFNAAETSYSLNLPIPSELNIINAWTYLPPAFNTGSDMEGFFQIRWTLVDAANPLDFAIRNMDWIGYSYQMATGAAGQSWNVLERLYTDVGT